MNNLFDSIKENDNGNIPLAERLRPKSFDEFFGQNHILNKNSFFYNMVNSKKISSMILWGPPGSGKTTIARLLCQSVDYDFIQISAVNTGVS